MKGKLVGIILLAALIASALTGCDDKPMTIEEAEDFYQQNETDIQAVVRYLQALDYESVGIDIGEGIYEGDDQLILKSSYTIQKKPLKDEPVYEAAYRLHEKGCHEIYMNREDNSIRFELWKTGMVGDADAGLLYAIENDEKALPTTQYLTEIQPLQADAWYYYIADYEAYRNQHYLP